jgi:hypothetical protein
MPNSLGDAVSAAKNALTGASKPAPTPTPAPKPAPTIGDELAAKKIMVDKARSALPPNMHKGGPVLTDGTYNLKAGEHVLAKGEADKARKHAILASGLKSLAKPGRKSNGVK